MGLKWVEISAQVLIESDQREAARELLTFYAHTRANKAIEAGRTMVDALEAYTKLSGKWRSPVGNKINDAGAGEETVNCLVGADPDKPPNKQSEARARRHKARLNIQ